MKDLVREATRFTPAVNFDPKNHRLKIEGESYPENIAEFYGPIMEWLTEYSRLSGKKRIHVRMNLLYFNSSSSKIFITMMEIFKTAVEEGNEVVIDWVFDAEDEDALEFGEDLKTDFQELRFNLIQREESGD